MSEKNVGGVPTAEMTGVIEFDGQREKLPHAPTTDNAHAVGQLRLLVQTLVSYKKVGLIQKRSQYDTLETAIERCAKFLDLLPEERGELPTPLGWQTSTTMQLSRGYDPSITFWSNTIPTILGDFSPVEALTYIEREWQRVADAAGYGWANTHWKFNDGYAYSESDFQLYMGKDGSGELHAWDAHGRALGTWTLSATDKVQRHAVVREMLDLSRAANHGKYRCSRCGELFPDPPAGRYFAGVYCGPCWEKPGQNGTASPKAQEARETYS